jgi:CheY-like chemotaxis protein
MARRRPTETHSATLLVSLAFSCVILKSFLLSSSVFPRVVPATAVKALARLLLKGSKHPTGTWRGLAFLIPERMAFFRIERGRSEDVFEEGDMKAKHNYRLPLDARTALPNGKGGGLHILIVEDDPDTAESTAMWLRYFGHRVQVALDGPSACQAAQSQPPDVVLLDLGLQGMDGWEVARRLQEPTWEKTPFFIAVTGCGDEEDRRRSREAGIDLHVVKPMDPDLLRRVLERFCRIIMPTEVSSTNETTSKSRESTRCTAVTAAE